ncbi:hypothetical protein C8R43DRAFT_1236593 [Mycena crocata]|nr:hypothetical protein C8R43DRAFT_1236593 [Mycena crocata]
MNIADCPQVLAVVYGDAKADGTPDVPGDNNRSVFRYKAIDGLHPEIFEVCETDETEVVSRPESSTYKLESFRVHTNTRPTDIPATFIYVEFVTAEGKAADTTFRKWYGDEHFPLFMKVPGWLRVRWYRMTPDGSTSTSQTPTDGEDADTVFKYLAIHELNNAEFPDSAEYIALSDTPRVAEMKRTLRRVELRAFELQKE